MLVLYDDLLIKKGGGQAASDLSSIKTFKFLLKLFTLTGLVIGVLWGHAPFSALLECPRKNAQNPRKAVFPTETLLWTNRVLSSREATDIKLPVIVGNTELAKSIVKISLI